MPAVKVSDLKVGQQFESDIKFNNGVVLFKAAEKVSEKHIKALKAWGFTEVGVKEAQSAVKINAAQPNSFYSNSSIEHIFSKTNQSDPVIIELKKISQKVIDS